MCRASLRKSDSAWADRVRSLEIARCRAAALSPVALHSAFPRLVHRREEKRRGWDGDTVSRHFVSRLARDSEPRIRTAVASGWPSWQDISSAGLDRSVRLEERERVVVELSLSSQKRQEELFSELASILFPRVSFLLGCVCFLFGSLFRVR